MSRFAEIQQSNASRIEFRTRTQMTPSRRLGKTDIAVSSKAESLLEGTRSAKEAKFTRNLSIPKFLNSAAVKTIQIGNNFFGNKLSLLVSVVSKAFASIFSAQYKFISGKISGRVSSERLSQRMEAESRKRELQTDDSGKTSSSRKTLDKHLANIAVEDVQKIHKLKTEPFSTSVGKPTQELQQANADEVQFCVDFCVDIVNKKTAAANLKETEDSSGIKTWTFTHNGRSYEINHSKKNHIYNGVKNKDFIKRAELIFDAVKDPKLNGLDPELAKLRDEMNDKFDALGKLCQDPSQKPEQFDEELNAASNILADIFNEVETHMKNNDPNFDLEQAEAEYIMNRGRPIIVNIFEVEAGGQTRTFVGIHKPMSEVTIPSSMQGQDKLANYVSTSAGVVRNGKVEIKFTGIRHSRPSPIAIEDRHQRRIIAASNVKQSIVDIAKTMKVNENNSESNPLLVPLAPTTLLTAKAGDSLRNISKDGKWTGESETMQLQEAIQAYRLYDGNAMEVNGKWIKPVIHHMNFGVNPAATEDVKIPIQDSPLQDKLNAHGMMSQHQLVKDYFSENIADEGLKNQVLDFLTCNSVNLKSQEYQYRRIKENIHRNLQKNQKDLAVQYETYKETPSAETRKKMSNLEKKIARDYKTLDTFGAKIVKEQKKAFLGQPDRREALENLKNKLKPELASLLQDQEDFRRAVFEEKHKKLSTVVDVPAMRNMIYQKMGIPSIFYCKSAEDRTGNVEIKTCARMMYEEMSGKPPGIVDCKEMDIKNEIFKQVFNASPSLNNTEQNSDARGLQISPKTNPPDMEQQIKRQKKMAGLAKKVPKMARKKVR